MNNKILLEKPISFWNRKFKIEKPFFIGLAKAIVDYSFGNWDKFIKDLFDTISSIKLATSVNEKAYSLIYKSLCTTSVQIFKNNSQLFNDIELIRKLILRDDFDLKLAELSISIDSSFFNNPEKTIFLNQFIEIFQNWLISAGINKNIASRLTRDFSRLYFVSLNNEWQANQSFYLEIIEYFENNPFLDYWNKKAISKAYHNHLVQFYNSVILGDEAGMNLSDIYIEPSLLIYRECFNKEYLKNNYEHEVFMEYPSKSKKNVSKGNYPWKQGSPLYNTIHSLINDSLFSFPKGSYAFKNPNPNVILILGYPGQGKTSFCYKTIHDIIEFQKDEMGELYFIKLRNLGQTTELVNNPLRVINDFVNDIYKLDKITTENKNIVILDGLDELYMKEGLSSSDIDDFCREIGRMSDLFPKTKFIVTSRYGYVNLEKLNKDNYLVVALKEFDIERQYKWSSKFLKFHPTCLLDRKKLDSINKNFKHLAELIKQPILLHLIATTNIELSESSNRSTIYDNLFNSLIERRWEKRGQIENLIGITKVDLRDYIREVALAIYQSDFEYIRKMDLENLSSTKSFLNKLQGGSLKDSLKSIMISFYFQEVARDENDFNDKDNSSYAIEFLHKSLQEYLVAEKIWFSFLDLIERKKNGSFFINNSDDAFELLEQILAPKGITKEVTNYLIEIISNEKDSAILLQLSKRLELFFGDFLSNYFSPSKQLPIGLINQSINFFYSYWTILSHVHSEKINISRENKEKFVNLIKWTSIREENYFKLSFQELTGLNLAGANLHKALFISSDFQTTSFSGCNFENARFENCTFENSILKRCNFREAKFKNCNFNNAILDSSIFDYTEFQNCNFESANFDHVNYIGVSFLSCNFKNSKLISAKDLFYAYNILRPINLDDKIELELKEQKPILFNKRK
jgi:pentapeptide repeat protein/NACHT conflict system protein